MDVKKSSFSVSGVSYVDVQVESFINSVTREELDTTLHTATKRIHLETCRGSKVKDYAYHDSKPKRWGL
jgi:hypothetical protein